MENKFSSPSDWAIYTLKEKGYSVIEGPTTIQQVPWSKIQCIYTHQDTLFLKTMLGPFDKEALLIDYLVSHTHHPNLPRVVAFETSLRCFLMNDAGLTLRYLSKQLYAVHHAKLALQYCAEIQLKSIPHIHSLLALGILDWRISQLPRYYEALINNTQFLKFNGLLPDAIKRLHHLQNSFNNLCQACEEYMIEDTLEHGDFQDKNILIKDNHITINDWGDSCISHPFFSCLLWLESMKYNHQLTPSDALYHQLIQAYLKPWLVFHSETHLLQAFKCARKIFPIYFVLNCKRNYQCTGIELYPDFQRYIKEMLEAFIANTQ